MDDWITLSKLLPQFLFPFNIVLVLLVCSLFLLIFRRGRSAGVALFLALAVLFICASPLSEKLYLQHERTFLPVAIGDATSADAIVLLGGDVRLPLVPRVESEVGGNRVVHALRLYNANKAPTIVVSGGNVFVQKDVQTEAYYTVALLRDWGVPPESILIEDKSRNTHENALETRKLLKSKEIDKILLVTSAFHMPRALATFRTAGVNAVPSPSSYSIVSYSRPKILDWFPSLGNLGKMQAFLREKLGIIVYRYRGWIT